ARELDGDVAPTRGVGRDQLAAILGAGDGAVGLVEVAGGDRRAAGSEAGSLDARGDEVLGFGEDRDDAGVEPQGGRAALGPESDGASAGAGQLVLGAVVDREAGAGAAGGGVA